MSATFQFIHDLGHRIMGLDYPHGHWLINVAATLLFVVAPVWTLSIGLRLAYRSYKAKRHRRARLVAATSRAPERPAASEPTRPLESYIIRATARPQAKLVIISIMTLPTAWLLLEIPKHIINHALADASDSGQVDMMLFGLPVDRITLLFALCAGYLGALTLNGLIKYAAMRIRGRVSERVVRRLRLGVLRRARADASAEQRAHLSAVVVQEVEPIGYFGGSLAVVPVIQGGALLISILFLLMQNPALALAALLMLPLQLTLLPGLQKRLNAKVRDRVRSTRKLGGLMVAGGSVSGNHGSYAGTGRGDLSVLRHQMRMTGSLETIRVEINDLKGRIKGLYNYTSNLTPFFFFTIGGYLVVRGQLSLGALVAALAAYREISPALRELFDFMQNWSDAKARFSEVTRAMGQVRTIPMAIDASQTPLRRERRAG
ncbi:multidrug ABC transporter ATPase [Bosea sp. (in: a-proteobacteria)]|uniref:multidrug ABC transporter ATPase n=1 Tax=Bosea sp. (in: a-proteobacteria) TaxID=1871050 RepID=UPI0025C354CA|nr:multidrug ABC transporter ATPase [Bosea sp. (in: a-proteobacteria)]